MVLYHALFFVLGLVLLVKGADYFVSSAASIAKKLGVSEFVIGLTLVALGTSLPEVASSITASVKGESGIVLGNVVGSNIANIGVIIGLAAILGGLKTSREMLERDGYIMLFAASVFYAFSFGGLIAWWEALLLLLLYVAYSAYVIEDKPRFEGRYHFREFVNYFFRLGYVRAGARMIKNARNKHRERSTDGSRVSIGRDLVILAAGGVAVLFGAQYLVDETVYFAELYSIPKSLVGLSLIALGTSLPELGVSLSAARKGYGNIAVGNIIGSNIANIFLIAGVTGLIGSLPVGTLMLSCSIPFMVFMSVLLLIFLKSGWVISKREGVTLFVLYTGFMLYMFLRGTG